MAVNAQEAVRNMISYTIVTDKDSLVRLLERNGVQMPNNPSDKEVTASVLLASAKSPNFKKELSSLLTSKVPQAGSDFASFVGMESVVSQVLTISLSQEQMSSSLQLHKRKQQLKPLQNNPVLLILTLKVKQVLVFSFQIWERQYLLLIPSMQV